MTTATENLNGSTSGQRLLFDDRIDQSDSLKHWKACNEREKYLIAQLRRQKLESQSGDLTMATSDVYLNHAIPLVNALTAKDFDTAAKIAIDLADTCSNQLGFDDDQ